MTELDTNFSDAPGEEFTSEHVEQPVNIEELFLKLRLLTLGLEAECKEIDDLIQTLQEKRAAKEELYAPAIGEVEDQIRVEILKLKKSYKCEFGSATYRKGRTSVSWNDDALNGYAVEHEEILKFRTEKTGEPSVSLKVGQQS